MCKQTKPPSPLDVAQVAKDSDVESEKTLRFGLTPELTEAMQLAADKDERPDATENGETNELAEETTRATKMKRKDEASTRKRKRSEEGGKSVKKPRIAAMTKKKKHKRRKK